MSFMPSSRPRPKNVLVYHIGGTSVRAAIVSLRKGDAPTVACVARERMPLRDIADPLRYTADMIGALKGAGVRIARDAANANMRIAKTVFVFSSPWVVSRTRTIAIDGIKSISKKQIDRLADLVAAEDAETGLKAIERRVADVRESGEAGFFTSLMPSALFERIMDAVPAAGAANGSQSVETHSFSLVSFSVVRDMFPEVRNFALIDVGGEVSDAMLVEKGIIQGIASFPVGSRGIVRRAAKELGVTGHEAASLLEMREAGAIDASIEKKLATAVLDASRLWKASCDGALRELASDTASKTMSKTFVVGTNPIFAEKYWTVVDASALKRHVIFAKGVKKDPALALIARFIV